MRLVSHLLCPALFAALALAGAASQAQDKSEQRSEQRIVFASFVDKESYAGRLLDLIYRDAFQQLHIEFEERIYPAARASVETAAGNADGEIARSYGYGPIHPELVRVEAPLLDATTSAYAYRPDIRVHGLESLRGSGYRIEYRAGYPVMLQHLLSVMPEASLSTAADAELGLKKLVAGRADIYVDVEETVLPLLEREPYKGAGIYKAGVVESNPLYCYLTRRHADLAPRLAEIFKKMRTSGALDRYRALARAQTAPR